MPKELSVSKIANIENLKNHSEIRFTVEFVLELDVSFEIHHIDVFKLAQFVVGKPIQFLIGRPFAGPLDRARVPVAGLFE